MFSCVFVTFPYGVLGQVWFFIVWLPDLLPYFYKDIQDKWVNISRSAFVNTLTVCLMF